MKLFNQSDVLVGLCTFCLGATFANHGYCSLLLTI